MILKNVSRTRRCYAIRCTRYAVRCTLYALSALCAPTTFSQDIHFSQFFLSPLTINPAQAGAIDDRVRVVANYRDQWRSLGTPFTTYAASVDAPLFKGKMKGRYIGVGLDAWQDKAGKSAFGDLRAGLSIAYNLRLSKLGQLAFGIQCAYGQRSANLNGLRWDNQYTGTNYDPALPTGEGVFAQQAIYIDLAAGLLWRHEIGGRKVLFGAAVHHPHQPNVSLIGTGADQLLMRISAHGEVHIDMDKFNVIPKILVSRQGGAFEAEVGAMLERALGESSRYTNASTSSSFQLGCFYRYLDAIIPAMFFDYHHALSIGVSYDLNISPLRTQTNLQGGLEVALVFHGRFGDNRRDIKSITPVK